MNPKKILAFILLFVGISLAAAYGSRNGPSHVDYRLAQGELKLLDAQLAESPNDSALKARQQELSAVTLPKPMARLTGWFRVGGFGWGAGVVLIIAGALLARRELQIEHRGEGDGAKEAVDFLANIQEIGERLESLGAILEELPMDQDSAQARALIDDIVTELIEPVVDQRGRFIARHGLGTFAEYFGAFSGGERNLARTWSAITDGHSEEARSSLVRSRAAFAQAQEHWEKAEQG